LEDDRELDFPTRDPLSTARSKFFYQFVIACSLRRDLFFSPCSDVLMIIFLVYLSPLTDFSMAVTAQRSAQPPHPSGGVRGR